MKQTLDTRQLEELRTTLRSRARQLREEIRQTLRKSDDEQYTMIADQVRDLEDDSFADLMVDVNLAEIDRDLQELRLIDASDTRRKHPLSHGSLALADAIELERLRLRPLQAICFDCQSVFERNHVQNIGHTL